MSGAVVGRFAPSPSGRLHLGNLACSCWPGSVPKAGGRIVLRIEDLDAERCPRIYADLLEQDLAWLGLVWDEGGSTGGPHGPYYQSECADIYTGQYKKLEAQGLVYPCFCSRAQLHAASAPHTSDATSSIPHLPGPDRRPDRRKAQKEGPGLPGAGADEEITFLDGCMGPHTENLLRDCGDFYLRRADGVFAYQLAVVVDDARMGVTEVVRGSDLLSSTRGSCTCTVCWACRLQPLPTARCCWPRTGGGCPSGTGTRAWRTCGKNTPRRRSWASWLMPTACSRNRRPARRKASSQVFPGQRCPSRTSACRRGCSESNYNKGRKRTFLVRFRPFALWVTARRFPGGAF